MGGVVGKIRVMHDVMWIASGLEGKEKRGTW